MVVLDATIVNVALPSIQRGLHFSPANLQWVVNAYTLIFGGFLLLGGRAADLLGRKRLFVAGVVLFSAASLLNGLAQSSGDADRRPRPAGPRRRARLPRRAVDHHDHLHRTRASARRRWASGARSPPAAPPSGCCSAASSPTSSRGAGSSSSTCPVGIVTIALALRYVAESRARPRHRRFDLAGAATVTGGLVVLVYAIVKAQAYGWGSARTLGARRLASRCWRCSSRSSAGRRRRWCGCASSGSARSRWRTRSLLLVASGMFGMFFFVSLYVQEILGYSPLQGRARVPAGDGRDRRSVPGSRSS